MCQQVGHWNASALKLKTVLQFTGILSCIVALMFSSSAVAQPAKSSKANAADPRVPNLRDAKNSKTGKPVPEEDPRYLSYGIYQDTAPRPQSAIPVITRLPLQLQPGQRILLIGNTLFDRSQLFGYFETLLHQRYPQHQLIVRHLAWSADTPDLQPRPENFADQEQHLTHEKADVIFAAYGFNESFAGEQGLAAFRLSLSNFVKSLKSKAFNGRTAPQIVLVSPTPCEDIDGVPAATLNNSRLQLYTTAMQQVAAEQQVGFANVFEPMLPAVSDLNSDLTFNGVHLLETGYEVFARTLYHSTFADDASAINEELRASVVDKNRQYFRRYRPLNTFYYTGGRRKTYGYLDFLPAWLKHDHKHDDHHAHKPHHPRD